ncbi:hypothetical protein NEUTE1DRAFT_115061 [Neurospora tetrasperma FGSC 2508]|uniref:Uncharacterized protein n=1 Tax=Neurospora tetrasperma (strain FGSC 2508 / ATCC MYA-4615 / P0657) TaxID=510951 RepID=F8N1Z1_NEUT8|nr:uncharacterized protein NEUTE1DRAFT_115061 [Neurospora tetrasperma FGSC 2508]EGO53215.1 hypothetical protein NEUTE1DRAFT_115061 [Neurospora tetrasperma FGSC 2508]
MCFYVLAHWKVCPQPLPGIPYNQTASHRILGDIPDLVTSARLTKEGKEEGARRAMRELNRFEPEHWLVRKKVKRGEGQVTYRELEEKKEKEEEEEEEEEVLDSVELPVLAFSAGSRGCFVLVVPRIVEWDGRSAKGVAQPAAVLCQGGGYLKQRLRLLLVPILDAVTEISKDDMRLAWILDW